MNTEKIINKICTRCNLNKSIDYFNKKSDSKTGYASECKDCKKNYRKTCKFSACTRQVKKEKLCDRHLEQMKSGVGLSPISLGQRKIATIIRNEFGQKQCQYCERWLDLNCFTKQNHAPDKLAYKCKLCRNLERHNISYDRFIKIISYQDWSCAVCKTKLNENINELCIDHDHSCCTKADSCGKCIRGILCRKCNMAEGLLKSDISIIENLLIYVKNGVNNDNI